MKIVAVVPMKLNNTRLPGKNIKSFTNGLPLCHYVLDTLLSIDMIEQTYVYCSNEDICKFIQPEIKFLSRPKKFDLDSAKMNDILFDFSQKIDADIYVMTHTTSPFINKKSILSGLNAVLSAKYDSAFAAKKIQDFLWQNGAPLNYELSNIPRTQDLPIIYSETSGFYIYKKEVINQKRRIGFKPFIVEVSEIEAIDIDEPEDFIIADAMYNYMKRDKNEM